MSSNSKSPSTAPLPRKVRGIRDTIPSGYMLARTDSGAGPVQVVPMQQWCSSPAFVNTRINTVALPKTALSSVAAHSVLLGEGTASFGAVAPAASGQLLIAQGASNDPAFKALSQDATITGAGVVTVTGLQANPVANTAPTDGQVLTWKASDGKWEPKTPASGTPYGSIIVDGTDVYVAETISLADPELVLAGGLPVYAKNPLQAANLNDYTTGTWTPTIKFGGGNTGIVYTINHGRYTKIGNMVLIQFLIATSSKGSSTGFMTIEGLPFPTLNDSNMRTPGTILPNSGVNNAAGGTIWSANGQVNAFNLQISYQNGGTITSVLDTDLANIAEMIGSFTYMTGS